MTTASFGAARLELVEGDITRVHVDAIVNAANSALAGGGGVDGAIHRAGGPSILQESMRIGGCPTGEVRATGAGNLPARYVLHAVGPIWHGGSHGESELLRSAYLNSLKLADELGCKSVAFPSISTGAYGFPIASAARIALETLTRYLQGPTRLERVLMVLFSAHDRAVYEKVLGELTT